MGNNIFEYHYFNEYALFMIPKDSDPGILAVRRFERAANELSYVDKKTLIMRDGGEKASFRMRMYAREQEKANQEQNKMRGVLEN